MIILGANNTFYEFSSVDTDDLIRHYQNDELPHDVKGPANYGNYTKKDRVVMRNRGRKRARPGVSAPTTAGLPAIVAPTSSAAAPSAARLHKRADAGDDDDADDDDDDDNDDDNDNGNDDNDNENDDNHGETSANKNGEIRRDMRIGPTGASAKPSRGDLDLSAPDPKRPHPDTSPRFNPLQEQVQRQFHNLYAVASQPERPQGAQAPFTRSNLGSGVYAHGSNSTSALRSNSNPLVIENAGSMAGSGTTAPATPRSFDAAMRHQTSTRPVLRVQIPSSAGTAIKSEPSSASSGRATGNSATQFHRSNDGRIELPRPTAPNNDSTPMQQSSVLEKHDKNHYLNAATSAGTLFNGLPSAITGSPLIQQYFATPLQPTPGGNSGPNTLAPALGVQPHGYLLQRQLQMAQQQHSQQLQSQAHSHAQSQSNPHLSNEASVGQLAGSLPSKFASDLVVPSPSTSMAMFHDWTFNRMGNNSSAAGGASATDATSNPTGNPSGNGSSGLTPYITVNQTPLSSKFFNFGEMTEDKDRKT